MILTNNTNEDIPYITLSKQDGYMGTHLGKPKTYLKFTDKALIFNNIVTINTSSHFFIICYYDYKKLTLKK